VILKFPKTFDDFISNYERVDLSSLYYSKIFNLDASQKNFFTFFQSINTKSFLSDKFIPIEIIKSEVMKTFKSVFQFNFFSKNYDFIIAMPYKRANQVQLDETVAIYIVMFYLSNVIRYKPQYLESLLNKKEALLINDFVKFSPLTFLRSIISQITRVNYIIDRR